MSMSIDLGDTHYGPFEFAIKQAFEAGIPFVAAAGNGDKNGRGLPQGVRPCK
jgi:hypothetical protein